MSNTKHTPGPWTVDDIQEGEVKPENDLHENKGWKYKAGYIMSGATILAEVKAMQTHVFVHDFDQFTANAKLIAAAPELLEALQKLKAWVGKLEDWKGEDPPCDIVDLAIKKATE